MIEAILGGIYTPLYLVIGSHITTFTVRSTSIGSRATCYLVLPTAINVVGVSVPTMYMVNAKGNNFG